MIALPPPVSGNAAAFLGRGWSDAGRRFAADLGICVGFASIESEPSEHLHASLRTLSRAGQHLRVGVHVAVHRRVEWAVGATLTDAARRLAPTDPASFGALCGEFFVAGVVVGSHFVGELELDARSGNAAHAWLRNRGALRDGLALDHFAALLEAFVSEFPVRASVLPEGSRVRAREASPEAFVIEAIGFPESDAAQQVKPYLALLSGYPARMQSGLPVDFDFEPPADPGRAVFASMRPRRSRAREMHLARPERRRPPQPAPARPVFRVERLPVRVLDVDRTPVYAGGKAPPDHYFEVGAGAIYWVPGAAAGTQRVRALIEAARERDRAAAPLAWVRRYARGEQAIYVTPSAPLDGVHRVRGGGGFAWIPGVSTPTPTERALVEEVAAAVPAVSARD